MTKEQDKFDESDSGCFHLLSNKALIAIALGKIDVVKVAKEIMICRGYNKKNEWVGSKAEFEWAFNKRKVVKK